MPKTRSHCGFCGVRLKRAMKQKQEGANPPSSLSTHQADYAAPMLGKSFGRLTVIELAAIKPRRWLCSCTCGAKKVVTGDALRRGLTRSCGCLKREGKKRSSDAATN